MKAKYIWLMGMLLAAGTVSAQTKKAAKTAYDDNLNNNYDRIHTVDGKKVEDIQMHRDGKIYKAELVNEKLTDLYVDGEKIPQADWTKYTGAIAAIRVQLELNRQQAKANARQARRNEEQNKLNEDQAKRNAEQAVRNEVQAKKNDEQQARNAEQAKRNAEQDEVNSQQAKHNAEQAARSEQQVKRNQEQNEGNNHQAKMNAEQAIRNEQQAKKNREQNARNAEQAKLNAEQAAANERFMKEFTEDLVSDKIIPDANSLKEFSLNKEEMVVNGVKQPDELFKKYSKKYSKQSNGFTYSRDGIIRNN